MMKFFFAVLCCIIPLSVQQQQYCTGYKINESQCGTTVVDALDLSIVCLNSSSAHITWMNKTDIQLVSLEYICFNQLSENYTTIKIQEDSFKPIGDIMFSQLNTSITGHSLCTLFGCVYIRGKDCWQLNEGNASCSDPNVTVSQIQSFTSPAGITSSNSAFIQTSSSSTVKQVDNVETTSSISPIHSTSTSRFIPPSVNPSNHQLSYVIITVVSISIFGVLLGLFLLSLPVFCVIWSKRNQKAISHHLEHKQDFNDLKISASTYTFTSVSMAGSIVTELNSLVVFEKEVPSSAEQTKMAEISKDQRDAPLLNNHFTIDNSGFDEGSAISNNAAFKLFPSSSLSPTPSDNSSYCKMSEPTSESSLSKADSQSSSTTSYNSTSSQEKSNKHDIDILSLQLQLKNMESCLDSSTRLDESFDNGAVFIAESNHETKFSFCEKKQMLEQFHQKENENFEIDFCDVDVNSESKH